MRARNGEVHVVGGEIRKHAENGRSTVERFGSRTSMYVMTGALRGFENRRGQSAWPELR